MQRWEGESREKLNEKLKLEQKAMLDEQLRSSGRYDDGTGRLAKSALRHGRRVQADEAVNLARGPSSSGPSFEPISSLNSGPGSPRGFGRALSEITRPMGDSDAARRAAQREELTQALAEQMKQREAEKLVYKLQIWDEERDDLERQGLAQVGHVVGKPRPDIPIDLVPYVKAIAPERMEGSRYGAPLLDLGPVKAPSSSTEPTAAFHAPLQRGAGASDGVAAALFRDNADSIDDVYDKLPARRGRRRFDMKENVASGEGDRVAVTDESPHIGQGRAVQPVRTNFNRSSHFTSNRGDDGADSPLQFASSAFPRGNEVESDGKRLHSREEQRDVRDDEMEEDEDDGAMKKLAAVEDRLDRIMSSLHGGGGRGGAGVEKLRQGADRGEAVKRRGGDDQPQDDRSSDLAGIMLQLLDEQRLLRETIQSQQQGGRGGGVSGGGGGRRGGSAITGKSNNTKENEAPSGQAREVGKVRSKSAVVGGRHREALLYAANSASAYRDEEEGEVSEARTRGGGGGEGGGRAAKAVVAKKPAFGRHDEGLTSAAMRRTSGELVLQLAAQRRAAALEAFKAERQQLKEQQAQERLERQSLRKKLPFRRHEIIKENAAAAHGGNELYRNKQQDNNRREAPSSFEPPQHQQFESFSDDRYSPQKRRTSPSSSSRPPQHQHYLSSSSPYIDDEAERMYPSSEPSYGGVERGARGRNNEVSNRASSLNQHHYNARSDDSSASARAASEDEGEFESAAILFAESRFIFPKTTEEENIPPPSREEQQPRSSSSSRQKTKTQSNVKTGSRGKSAGSASGRGGGGGGGGGGGILNLLKK